MAHVTVRVDDAEVVALLENNHGLTVGDAITQATEVGFDPRVANDQGQVVTVTLKYMLNGAEMDRLLGRA